MGKIRPVTLLAASALALAGCGGGSANPETAQLTTQANAPVPEPVPTASPAPTPTPTPTPTAGSIVGDDTSAGYPQLRPIATNFPVGDKLQAAWGHGRIPDVQNDVVGAFRFNCKPSHLAYDDPIVYPGQPGRSHLHMFFGNTEANGNSTYESLRTTGGSTCNNALNRSAYWIPALLDGRGNVVMAEYVSIYYKRHPMNDPVCAEGKGCIGLPRGLRYVFGRTMDGRLDSPVKTQWFRCDALGEAFDTLVDAAKNCPNGANIGAVVVAPDCWNGRELDSPDHRSHVSYVKMDEHTGRGTCPSTHPYRIPTFTLAAWFKTDDTLDRSGNPDPSLQTWHFSSDRMAGMTPMTSGQTFHADWFGAWDDNVLATWLANCIDLKLNCSGADLGNGQQLAFSDEHLREYARRVPVPARPGT